MLKTASIPELLENELVIDNQKNPTNVFTECEQERGCHLQRFQNSFLSLESVYLPRTSVKALTCLCACHWSQLSQNRNDFGTITNDIFCIWQLWQSGCLHHMKRLTE